MCLQKATNHDWKHGTYTNLKTNPAYKYDV